MGYATVFSEFGDWFEFAGSSSTSRPNLTTVSADYTLNSIAIPTYVKRVKHAYLDFHVGRIYNSSGGANYNAVNCYVQAQLGAGAFHNAIFISEGMFYCPTATSVNPGFTIRGTEDIKADVASGGTIYTKINDCSVFANNLLLCDPLVSLRVMLE